MPFRLETGGGAGGNIGIESAPIVFTAAPLALGGTWTSAPFATIGFDKIVITMRADQNGTIVVYQGPDGITWNAMSEDDFEPLVNPTEGFIVDVIAPHAYVEFQNTSGIDMTVTDIQARRKY